MRVLSAVLAAGLGWGVAGADCAPEKLVRIVFHEVSSEVELGSFAAKPRTLYRLGARHGRLEEALDAENGIHGLLIAAEPDVWLVNLVSKTGQHVLDRSEPYVFRAPVYGSPDADGILKAFEYGCELDFMKDRGVQPKREVVAGRNMDLYALSEGGREIRLGVESGTGRPLYVVFSKDGARPERRIEYDRYEVGLKPDKSLFQPPSGIAITEAKPAAAAPKGSSANTTARDGSSADPVEDVERRIVNFYRAPTREEFDAIQEGMRRNLAAFETEEHGIDLISAVFLARVHGKYSWPLQDLGGLDDRAKEISGTKGGRLHDYVADDEQIDPSKLDVWWTSYFATGETSYLDKLFAQVGDVKAQKGVDRILVTGAANWSVTSNCRQHPPVLEYARSVLARNPAPRNAASLRSVVVAAESPE